MSNMLTEAFYKPIQKKFTELSSKANFNREIGFAIQLFKKNPYMQGCDLESVLEAVYNVSQTGLTLNPILKYGYLIPRKQKNKIVCVFEPGYQGLIKLAADSENIISINVQLVYEGDDIEIDLSTPEKIQKHVPYLLTGKDKGNVLFGYSMATLSDGTVHPEIMSISQIHEVRECSESYKSYISKTQKGQWASSVWVSDPHEMYRKTVVKRHFKYLPKSRNSALEKAIELDNIDYDFPMSYEQGNYIESLLLSSSIPEKQEQQIFRALGEGMTQKRAKECIDYLLEHQTDNIAAGKNYTQGDIQKKLSQIS